MAVHQTPPLEEETRCTLEQSSSGGPSQGMDTGEGGREGRGQKGERATYCGTSVRMLVVGRIQ
jgi:hypothetical protein